MLEREHRRRGSVDVAAEVDRPLEDRGEEIFVLDPRRRVLVLDDQRCVREVQVEQLTGGELVIEPVDAAILQIGEWIMARRARQLVFAQNRLLLPCIAEVSRVRRDLAVAMVAAR